MRWNENIKGFAKSFLSLVKQHNEFYHHKRIYRCKVAAVEKDSRTDAFVILVDIIGIKNQLPIKFTPEELITNDALLMEFSQIDVRAITYCALQKTPEILPERNFQLANKFRIKSQELLQGKTIFVIVQGDVAIESRISAHDLFSSDFLKNFCFEDIRNIVYTATFEQTMEEME